MDKCNLHKRSEESQVEKDGTLHGSVVLLSLQLQQKSEVGSQETRGTLGTVEYDIYKVYELSLLGS